MGASKSNVADYHFIYQTETDKALCVKQSENDDNDLWLPKSQIDFDGKDYSRGDVITVTIPDWLAEKNDLA